MFWLFAVLMWLGISVEPAHAYLDPGAGSFVIQLLLAGMLTVGASIKMFWQQIKTFWRETILRHDPPPPNGQ